MSNRNLADQLRSNADKYCTAQSARVRPHVTRSYNTIYTLLLEASNEGKRSLVWNWATARDGLYDTEIQIILGEVAHLFKRDGLTVQWPGGTTQLVFEW